MLLRFGFLGGCEDEIDEREGGSGIGHATGLNRNVDELEQAIGLLLSEFDRDFHVRPQCRKRQADPQPKPAQPEAASEARSSQEEATAAEEP